MVTGADGAKDPAVQVLKRSNIDRMNSAQVSMPVERAVVAGIENGDDHPNASGCPAAAGQCRRRKCDWGPPAWVDVLCKPWGALG